MKYREFKEKIKEWGEIYHLYPVLEDSSDYVFMTLDDEKVFEIHKTKRFAIDLNYPSFRSLFENVRNHLFEIVTELAATKLEDREDRRTFRFEIPAFTEIDIEAKDLNEARKKADEIWHETFEKGEAEE